VDLTPKHYIVDANGTKTAVILSIAQYEQLLEDLHDLAIVADRPSAQPPQLSWQPFIDSLSLFSDDFMATREQ